MLKSYRCSVGGVIITDLETLPTCRLKKLATDDTAFEFREDVSFIGKTYKYSPASRRVVDGRNVFKNINWQHEIVLVYEDGSESFGIMPTECLDFSLPAQ